MRIRWVVVLLLAAQAAQADDDAQQRLFAEDKYRPSAIIVSGGVSLGSYQAGLLTFYTQVLLRQRMAVEAETHAEVTEPTYVTGASAGAVNAFLAAIAGCRDPITDPTTSPFYLAWIDIGFDELLNLNDVTPISLLSRAPIEKAVTRISELWSGNNAKLTGGWRQELCRVNLGFTVTRVAPRYVSPDDAKRLNLPLQTERVVLTLEGRNRQSPAVTARLPPEGVDRDFYPAFDIHAAAGSPFPTSAADVLKASASFPVAWEFIPLRTTLLGGTPRTDDFLDGGVFDNNPLGLAANLVRWSRGEGLLLRGRARPRFLYVEPDATEWAQLVDENAPTRRSFLNTYPKLLGNLVGTARKAELLTTIENDASHEVKGRIDVPLRRWPITGSYLLNFLAFLEKDFRRFDFFMGMADAKEQLDEDATHAGLGREGLSATVFPASKELACVLAFRAQVHAREGAGVDAHLHDLSNNVQSMRDLTPADATRAEKKTASEADDTRRAEAIADARARLATLDAKDVPACDPLVHGGPRDAAFVALLNASHEMRAFIKGDCAFRKDGCSGNDELEQFSALLQKHGYVFEDAEARGGTLVGAVRMKFAPVVDAFSWKQPPLEAVALSTLGKLGLDLLSYRPSNWYTGVGLHSRNGFEVEVSKHVGGLFRLDAGMRITRIASHFLQGTRPTPSERYTATFEYFANPLSIELVPQLPWWLRFQLQTGVSANLIYADGRPAAARFAWQGAVTVQLLQRIFFRVNFSRFFDGCDQGPCRVGGLLGVYSSAADQRELMGFDGDYSFVLGWRILG